ncbi:hypothetical protein EVAR_71357_1 [Eumeta japonica]|uniref:Uncharacterized protein n=1 Tax=Eumeta variegata TaxID=151549 RepID=A0A4C1SN55_EUMVA|nr:hypothetical protein EVAR_71357_1 [Eumeta japonica]
MLLFATCDSKKGSTINVSLVAAKNKVSPLKPLSIPRLELQAAVLGTRLAKHILQVREIKTDCQFWWSDSKTVLRWLTIDPKRFHQFVMHRVGEIQENTNLNQWKWVPTKQNPADLATKVPAQNHETALNEIKGQYHIPKLRVLYRKIRRMCQWCKINYAMLQAPQMAALPLARLAAFQNVHSLTLA